MSPPPSMRAMQFLSPGEPLRAVDVPTPQPGPGQVLVRVSACAVCRTDLHVVDGELPNPKVPLIPGHEVVGRVAALVPNPAGSRSVSASGFPGWAGPAAHTIFAVQAVKTFANRRALPVTRSMAVIRSIWSPTSGFAFRFHRSTGMLRRRPCSAPD